MSKTKTKSKLKKKNVTRLLAPDQLFYWAYGSNLNVNQMRRRCPKAVAFEPMDVQNCALIFRAVADVTMREGAVTPGGLWKITPDCERSLDQYEGVASGLYLKRYFQIKVDGSERKHTCLFYQMKTKVGILPPSEEYLGTIVQGYRDFGLDMGLLDMYLQEAWGGKQVTDDLLERHLRRGKPKLAKTIHDLPVRHEARPLLPAPMFGDEHDQHLKGR